MNSDFVSLVKDHLVPAVRADHPVISARRLRLADLLDFDWIIYRRGHTGLDVFEQTFASNHLALPKSTIQCTSFSCALALVEKGDYITLVPSQLFLEGHAPHSIALLSLDAPMQPWQVAVISRARHDYPRFASPFLLKSSAWQPELRHQKARFDLPINRGRWARLRLIAQIDQHFDKRHQVKIVSYL